MNEPVASHGNEGTDPHAAALLAAYPAGRRLAHRIAGERGDDLAQDAFLRRFIVRYRYAARDLPKILTVAVQRTWIDWGRAVERHPESPLPDHWLSGAGHDHEALLPESLTYRVTPEMIVVRADERARVRQVVAALAPVDRDALVDVYWHGRSMPTNDPTFKARVQWARRRFARAWDEAA